MTFRRPTAIDSYQLTPFAFNTNFDYCVHQKEPCKHDNLSCISNLLSWFFAEPCGASYRAPNHSSPGMTLRRKSRLPYSYRVSVMNTAPSCGLPTHCRSGTKFPVARLSEPALPFLVLFGRETTWWKVLQFVVMKSLRFRETNHENVWKKSIMEFQTLELWFHLFGYFIVVTSNQVHVSIFFYP